MKGTFFSKPLEWNVETQGESWQQGGTITGVLKVKNHGTESIDLSSSGVSLSFADIKKVHTRAAGAFKREGSAPLSIKDLAPGAETSVNFSFPLSPNCPVTDKKASLYLAYGKGFEENSLQVKIEPKVLYTKIVSFMDTFQRFKLKEYKTSKKGVEFKLLPPTSRDMANIESLGLTFSMNDETLVLDFDFQVKKLDHASITTKINKMSVQLSKTLTPKEYSLGKDLVNQDQILKALEAVIAEVKLKSVF